LVMGVPGKAIRAVSETEQARIREGVAHYLDYAREYTAALDLPSPYGGGGTMHKKEQ